jgi:hypothetical protein
MRNLQRKRKIKTIEQAAYAAAEEYVFSLVMHSQPNECRERDDRLRHCARPPVGSQCDPSLGVLNWPGMRVGEISCGIHIHEMNRL